MATAIASPTAAKSEKRKKSAWKNLPDVWALIKPRRGLLAMGFVLMAVNRLAGLVLPASTKYLVDNVISKRQIQLLTPIVLGVLGATVIQGLTSFTLTQLLSKSAQKMIADLRRQVQAHIGRLPVSFYDANKTGALVSRIMSDVEGVRNLIGTGLVEFVGGLMTAVIALVYLIHTSVTMTGVAFAILLVFGYGINKAFATIRPIFRARPKINAEVTGRLTESLSGVRVVKGYHAEEREEGVFAGGVQRLLDNVLTTLTATSLMSLSAAGLMGIVSDITMELGAHTIIGLIAAFYVPSSGRVLVDGVDLSAVKLNSYRTQLGVVLQETFLFDGTIRENVAFARPNATEEEIIAACHIARVDEFAESFENKYDTVVGERGVKLSGGQKQRVSIARAILADPRILILDEATSSLDSESEALIQEGLRYLMRGRTTFVIAHRLSTIRRADQILVVEAGRVIERGTHETLYALGGRYYDLYTKQHAVEANPFLAPGEGSDQDDSTGVEIQAGGNSRGDAALPDAIRIIRGQNS